MCFTFVLFFLLLYLVGVWCVNECVCVFGCGWGVWGVCVGGVVCVHVKPLSTEDTFPYTNEDTSWIEAPTQLVNTQTLEKKDKKKTKKQNKRI